MSINCPACHAPMEKVKHPDITVDKCAKCEGTFFDKGELNVMATGMTGDIEFCSIDEQQQDDTFPHRKCPRCPDKEMQKTALLCYSDVILDYCEGCAGFFFDKGEIKEMNVELEKLAGSKRAEEYRKYHDKYLVRLDKLSDVMASGYGMGLTIATNVTYLRLSVYYDKPLNVGLRIYSEKWTDKLIKTIGLSKKQDIEIGDSDFDSAFIIQGDDVSKVKSILSVEVREKMLSLIKNPPKIISSHGTLKVLDKRILYTEGPYRGTATYDMSKDPAGIVSRLIQLAQLLSNWETKVPLS